MCPRTTAIYVSPYYRFVRGLISSGTRDEAVIFFFFGDEVGVDEALSY
jgi:hypothetical protein